MLLLLHWGLFLKCRITCYLRLVLAAVSFITFVDSRASFKALPKRVSSEVKLLQVIRTRAVSEDETRLLL